MSGRGPVLFWSVLRTVFLALSFGLMIAAALGLLDRG